MTHLPSKSTRFVFFVGVFPGHHPMLIIPLMTFPRVPSGVGLGLKIKHLASAIRGST